MIRLLQIEWFKLRHYRPFWVLISMYAILATIVCSGGMFFLEFLKSKGADFKGINPTMLPIYDFPDIWHNLTFVSSNIKIILAFIVVMSIYNEINHRIVRQNIIDGLSKKQWLGSKLIFIGAIALGASLMVFVNGLILGLIYSHPDAYSAIFQKLEFIAAYFLDVFAFLCFAMMLTLLFRKGGLVIVGLLMYTLMFEPFVSMFFYNMDELPVYFKSIPNYFPVMSLRNLIQSPFWKYILSETHDFIGLKELLIVLGWLCFNISASYFMLKKRDI